MLPDVLGAAPITGPLSIRIDTATKGDTPGTLLRGLSGKMSVDVGQGAIQGFDLAAAVGALAESPSHSLSEFFGGRTDFASMKAAFVLRDGIAHTGDLTLTGETIDLAFAGETDILSQTLSLRGTGHAHASESTEPVRDVPLVLRGSWSSPLLLPDLDRMRNAAGTISKVRNLRGLPYNYVMQ
jgi:uncharacterized protein involved in outer membrane biogenesis